MPYEVLDHTADTGLQATAGSLHGLIAEMASGMFSLVAVVSAPVRWVETTVTAASQEDLVVVALSELIYLSEVEDLVFGPIDVTATESPGEIRIRAGGIPSGTATLIGPPIKAITYHDLIVEERRSGWYGRAYFDV